MVCRDNKKNYKDINGEKMKDVSIIIVNYNTLELTKNTIESVFEKTEGITYEIILVDNASNDGSAEFFKNNYKDKIIFIKNDKNLGFGKANNKGIQISKGKYIFLLNSDTLLINNAVKILCDNLKKEESYGVVGGALYTQDLQPTNSFMRETPYVTIKTEINLCLNYLKKIILKFQKKKEQFNYTNKNLVVGAISGADMMIKKEVLDKVGGFDEDFFMYCEEVELSYRISKAGYKSISVPEAKIIHLEGKSTCFKENKHRMMLESKYKYFYKIANLQTCRYVYYISQIGYLFSLILKLNKDYWKVYKINSDEYRKFLQNYKNLRKDY